MLREVLQGMRDTFTTQRIESLLREPHTLDAMCDPVGNNAQLPRYRSVADTG